LSVAFKRSLLLLPAHLSIFFRYVWTMMYEGSNSWSKGIAICEREKRDGSFILVYRIVMAYTSFFFTILFVPIV
jgi:hypothetical protein